MKNLLSAGSLYLKKMDLTDMAMLKFCMGALGVLLGLGAAKHHKKSAGILAGLVFAATLIPLLGKWLLVLTTVQEDQLNG